MDETQKGLLEDLILEMMESNQNLVKLDSSSIKSHSYLNDITANTWASFEQLTTIAEVMTGNKLAEIEAEKERNALTERMLGALEGIEDNTKKGPEKKDLAVEGMGLGGLGALLAGMVAGYITQLKKVASAFTVLVKSVAGGLFNVLKGGLTWLFGQFSKTALYKKIVSVVAGVSMQFDLLMDSIKTFFKSGSIGNVIERMSNLWKSTKEFFIRPFEFISKEFSKFSTMIMPIISKIKGVIAPIFDLGGRMDDLKNAFTFIRDSVMNVFNKVKSALGMVGAGNSILAQVGKFIGRFLAPVAFLMTLWDTVKGAIKGYEEGGIIGAVKGALTGFLSSIIGAPLDLIKQFASWIAGALGFKKFEAMLDSFDFTALIKNGVEGIFNWFKTLFSDPGAALTTAWNNLVGEGGLIDILFKPINMFIDWITKKLGFRPEDAPEFSLGNVMRSVWNTLIDWVASLVEQIPLVGKKGAEMIRALSAGAATANIGQMGAASSTPPSAPSQTPASATPERVANPTGDSLNRSAADSRNTAAVGEAVKESGAVAAAAPAQGAAPMAGSGAGGGNSSATYNISNSNLPDRTDWSVRSGMFGIAA